MEVTTWILALTTTVFTATIKRMGLREVEKVCPGYRTLVNHRVGFASPIFIPAGPFLLQGKQGPEYPRRAGRIICPLKNESSA